MLYAFRRLHVRRVSAGFGHHLAKQIRIFQHRAGTQVIVIERLPIMIGHEDRRLEALQQGLLADIGVGVVDKHAGIHIAIGIDVQVSAATGNAATHIFSIILKIHGKQRLCPAIVADSVIDFRPLLRCWQQLWRGIIAYRHIVEIPDKICALFDQAVIKINHSAALRPHK